MGTMMKAMATLIRTHVVLLKYQENSTVSRLRVSRQCDMRCPLFHVQVLRIRHTLLIG